MGGDQADDAAHAEARHWRAVADEREATLRELRRRPLVRVALGVDRRASPALRRASVWWRPRRRAASRAAVRAGGILARPRLASRQRTVDSQAGALPNGASPTRATVLTIGTWLDERWCAQAGLPVDVTRVDGLADLAGAAQRASGEVLCFVPEAVPPATDGWLARAVDALGDGIVAATPTILHPRRAGRDATEHDLLVRSEGFDVRLSPTGAPVLEARGAGASPALDRPPVAVPAAPLTALVVDRAAYLASGGIDGSDHLDRPAAIGVDLCARLRRGGGHVVHVPGSAVFDRSPIDSRRALRSPIDPLDPQWRRIVEEHGASLLGTRPPRPRWVLTTAAPSRKVAQRWGDTHLADALGRALTRLGHDVVVQTRDDADALSTRARDVHVVVRGLAPIRRTPGQVHVLWIISHPESIDIDECDAADLVLVASERFADHLRARTSTPVEVLLQATDPQRFHPRPVDAAHAHPVTIVAKTREVMRAVVADALAAGIRPAIYGGGWAGLVDPQLVVADHVDNADLPVVYSSAGVVLNDHWDTMRHWGFVSNRIFDVLACGTPVISDDVAEIHDLLGDAVPTYRTSAELGDAVKHALDDPAAARAAAEAGRQQVLAHHTFEHRAHQLLDALARHGIELAGVTPG